MVHEDFLTLDGAVRAGAEGCREVSAVYFLYKDGALVYIGKSVNALSRTKYHSLTGWDEAVSLPTPADKLDEVERMMIEALQPPWNRFGVNPENWQDRRKSARLDNGCKTIGVQCDQEQVALIEVAAAEMGMPVSTWMRYVAVREAKSMGLHLKQPKVD